jgi:GT2 family glycosyltransferase
MTVALSVVLPCLDAARFLPEQLEALAAQRFDGAWEVIVADNGSTDGSQALAESFRGRLPGLRVVDASDRRGQAHARNAGARAAAGEWLVFCDCDDVVGEGYLAAMARALSEHPFVAPRFDTARLNPPWIDASRENAQRSGLGVYTYPPFLPHAGGSGLGVWHRVHESVGGFDEEMAILEDTDYCWRIQLAGTPLHFAPEAVIHVRYRPDLAGTFRQALAYGESNVSIYKKYRPLGMPRLGWTPGAARWAKLLLSLPQLATRAGRARWISSLGWRLGRLRGCLRYRVLAP